VIVREVSITVRAARGLPMLDRRVLSFADRLLSDVATVRSGSFAHCRIFESGGSAAILLTSLVEILQ
jgi:hypothetical protein